MLRPLLRKKSFSVWADTRIEPGATWKEEIIEALGSAKVAVLLVSPDFLASEFIAKHELPPLLAAAKDKGLKVLWVYIRPCLYEETEINDYQAAHDISRPLASLRGANRDNVLVEICQRIKTNVTP
jgi:hypothetical protein